MKSSLIFERKSIIKNKNAVVKNYAEKKEGSFLVYLGFGILHMMLLFICI
jgi:hypothetical protein